MSFFGLRFAAPGGGVERFDLLASDAEFDRAELAPRLGDVEGDVHGGCARRRETSSHYLGRVNTLPSLRLILCTAFHLALD
jgi:hypothetical protein